MEIKRQPHHIEMKSKQIKLASDTVCEMKGMNACIESDTATTEGNAPIHVHTQVRTYM